MMTLNTLALVQALIAPVVMISACGLLCLAYYNRLAAIVSRARSFNKETHDLTLKLAAAERAGDTTAGSEIHHRIELLKSQFQQILVRARLVRRTLVCLLITILCMIGCSLAAGLSGFPGFDALTRWGALICYFVGIAEFALGIIFALLELRRALDPVALEWRDQELDPE